MSAIFSNFRLIIILTVLFFSLSPPPFLFAAAKVKTPLAIKVCRNTKDFKFCRQSMYSDSRAATADRVILAYISFGNAYSHANDTSYYIASQIKKSAKADESKDDVVRGLKNCLANYNETVRAISEVMRDLDDESYYEFDILSLDAENNTRACESGFNGKSPMKRRNVISIKLANICYVVSKLFQ